MIGQCLSNKNENATVPKSKKISDLNKASVTKKKARENGNVMYIAKSTTAAKNYYDGIFVCLDHGNSLQR